MTTTQTTKYYRFGTLPQDAGRDYFGEALGRRSTNHRDGSLEDGVSVYPGTFADGVLTLDLRGIDATSAIFIADGREVYEVTGDLATPEDARFDFDALDDDGTRGAWVAREHLGADGEPLLRGDIAATLTAPTAIHARLTDTGEPIRIR